MYEVSLVKEKMDEYNAFMKLMGLKLDINEADAYYSAQENYIKAEQEYNNAQSHARFAQKQANEAGSEASAARINYVRSEWFPSLAKDKVNKKEFEEQLANTNYSNAIDRLDSANRDLSRSAAAAKNKILSFVDPEQKALMCAENVSNSFPQYGIGYYMIADFWARTAIFYSQLWQELCATKWQNKIRNKFSYINKNIQQVQERIKNYQNALKNAKEFLVEEEKTLFADFIAKVDGYAKELESETEALHNQIVKPIEEEQQRRLEEYKRTQEDEKLKQEKLKKQQKKGLIIGIIMIAAFIIGVKFILPLIFGN
ncbi:MAG: hypothetical protein J1F36_04615 [Clostridiales bacterium]|nr:hypothetical protein [Clostridiales bacterium]